MGLKKSSFGKESRDTGQKHSHGAIWLGSFGEATAWAT